MILTAVCILLCGICDRIRGAGYQLDVKEAHLPLKLLATGLYGWCLAALLGHLADWTTAIVTVGWVIGSRFAWPQAYWDAYTQGTFTHAGLYDMCHRGILWGVWVTPAIVLDFHVAAILLASVLVFPLTPYIGHRLLDMEHYGIIPWRKDRISFTMVEVSRGLLIGALVALGGAIR